MPATGSATKAATVSVLGRICCPSARRRPHRTRSFAEGAAEAVVNGDVVNPAEWVEIAPEGSHTGSAIAPAVNPCSLLPPIIFTLSGLPAIFQ